MSPRSLQLFRKKKGVYLQPEQWIGIVLTVLLFAIAYLEQSLKIDIHNLVIISAIIWFIYIVGLMISNFFRYGKANGEFSGKITFWGNKVQVNNLEFDLSEITTLNFIKAYDIRGTFINSMLEFRPHLSNGLDNELILSLKNGKKIKENFLQTDTHRLKYYREILIHYYHSGIIEWLQLLNILEINEYEKIQEFKKEIKNYGQHGV